MVGNVERVALVSMHTSPAQQAGTGDSGGMNVSLLGIAMQLAARGIEVDLLSRAEGDSVITELAPGVILRELPAGPPRKLDKAELVAVADEFGEAVAVATGRDSPRYDLIHAHYWLSGLATLPVAIEFGIPFVQSFHTLGAMKNRTLAAGQIPEPAGRIRSETYLANQADAVVAASSAEVASLLDEVGAPAKRIWVIPPGVDVDLFRPDRLGAGERVRESLAIEAGRPIIAVVGRVQPLKDQELGLRALASLAALRGWAPVLVIAGEATPGDEGYLASLKRLAVELGVADEVRFAGALTRDDLADLLAVASITLVPSHSETFGLVALESAASGTAVIGFSGTGLKDSVAEGESGLLLESRDPRAWAQAMATLLDDPSARSRLSESARQHASRFTWEANSAALAGVYESLVSP